MLQLYNFNKLIKNQYVLRSKYFSLLCLVVNILEAYFVIKQNNFYEVTDLILHWFKKIQIINHKQFSYCFSDKHFKNRT